jgi:hypothetical protein
MEVTSFPQKSIKPMSKWKVRATPNTLPTASVRYTLLLSERGFAKANTTMGGVSNI